MPAGLADPRPTLTVDPRGDPPERVLAHWGRAQAREDRDPPAPQFLDAFRRRHPGRAADLERLLASYRR